MLVLPYYGAETFGLHAIGRAGLTDPSVMPLVDEVRDHPAAITTFGIGLLLLAVSGVAVAIAWQGAVRAGRWAAPSWAAWPLAGGAARPGVGTVAEGQRVEAEVEGIGVLATPVRR